MKNEALEEAVDEELVERTMKLLLEHDRTSAKGLTLIGEHVLDHYFDGDEASAKSKRPTKEKTFARLAERAKAESSFKKRDLYRAVSMAIVWRSLSTQVRDKLEPTHFEKLASIDDVATRREVAARIADGELAGRALDKEIAKRGKRERGGGPKPKHAAEKMTDAVERALDEVEKGGELGKRALRALEKKTRGGLGKRLRAVAKRLQAIAKRIEA